MLTNELREKLVGLGVEFDDYGCAHYGMLTTDPLDDGAGILDEDGYGIYIDYLALPGGYVALEAVVDAAHFTEGIGYYIVEADYAEGEARGLVDLAIQWHYDNETSFDEEDGAACGEQFVAEVRRAAERSRKL